MPRNDAHLTYRQLEMPRHQLDNAPVRQVALCQLTDRHLEMILRFLHEFLLFGAGFYPEFYVHCSIILHYLDEIFMLEYTYFSVWRVRPLTALSRNQTPTKNIAQAVFFVGNSEIFKEILIVKSALFRL